MYYEIIVSNVVSFKIQSKCHKAENYKCQKIKKKERKREAF